MNEIMKASFEGAAKTKIWPLGWIETASGVSFMPQVGPLKGEIQRARLKDEVVRVT